MALSETLTATAGDVVRVERKCFDRNTEDTLTITGEVTEVDGTPVASDPSWITIHAIIDGILSGRKQGRLLMDVDTGALEAEGVREFKVRGSVSDEHFEPVEKVFTITVSELSKVYVAHSSLGIVGLTFGPASIERTAVLGGVFPDYAVYSWANDYVYYDASATVIERVRPDGTEQSQLIDLSTDVDGGARTSTCWASRRMRRPGRSTWPRAEARTTSSRASYG